MNPESIQIRGVRPHDIGAAALVIARANAQRDGESLPITATCGQISDLRQRMDKPHAWTYVAVEGGRVAGLALGYPRIDENTSHY